ASRATACSSKATNRTYPSCRATTLAISALSHRKTVPTKSEPVIRKTAVGKPREEPARSPGVEPRTLRRRHHARHGHNAAYYSADCSCAWIWRNRRGGCWNRQDRIYRLHHSVPTFAYLRRIPRRLWPALVAYPSKTLRMTCPVIRAGCPLRL